MPEHRLLVTGANGFVGHAVVERATAGPWVDVRAAFRGAPPKLASPASPVLIGDIDAHTDWSSGVRNVDVVVHTAARVHVMRDRKTDSLEEYRRVNVKGTLNLARQAAEAGVRRFIFISSIKVNGESTPAGRPFRADDRPAPVDPYGTSKLEAELALRHLAANSALEVVVIRPPLVYGPGVRANFRSMMGLLRLGVPLPLGAIDNRRTLIGLDNLCDLITTCAQHPAAAGRTFLTGDGEDVSTSELLRRLGLALDQPARLLPVPAQLLQAALTALGRRDIGQRLCSSLQVDVAQARDVLGWSPPVSLDEGLRRAAQAYLAETGRVSTASG